MNWLQKAITSTIGRKILVSLTGILLCVFLVGHLGGNLLMFVGADAYNEYAHTLHSIPGLVPATEVGLTILFVLHIYIALSTEVKNRQARGGTYDVKETKQADKKLGLSAENWMALSGVIFLTFLIVHMLDFPAKVTFTNLKDAEPFDKAIYILNDPTRAVLYSIGSLILAWHLSHGARSMFQTLGLNHSKYNPLFKAIAGFLVIVAATFAVFPIYASILGVDEKATVSQDDDSAKPEHQSAELPEETSKK